MIVCYINIHTWFHYFVHSYSLEKTVQKIELNSDLKKPAVNVMTADAAAEYEMKLLRQAIEESLREQEVRCPCFFVIIIVIFTREYPWWLKITARDTVYLAVHPIQAPTNQQNYRAAEHN